MGTEMNRREFVVAGALAGASLAAPTTLAGAPAVHVRRARPVVIASANGNASRDADGKTCVVKAFELMTQGGVLAPCLEPIIGVAELVGRAGEGDALPVRGGLKVPSLHLRAANEREPSAEGEEPR